VSRIIGGRFLVLRKIGEGAAGEILEAMLLQDTEYAARGSHVAIKQYKPWVLEKPEQSYRIERELRTGTEIHCPNLIKSHEVVGMDDKLFLIMEFVQGPTLREWMQKRRTFEEIMSVFSNVVTALFALHSRGLIHRDVKPENIVIAGRGAVLLDLGVIRDINVSTMTAGKEFLGTVRYAAPEYLFAKEYNANIDIYSLGLILQELINGAALHPEDLFWSELVRARYSEALPYESPEHWNFPHLFGLDTKQKFFLRALLLGTLHNCVQQRFAKPHRLSSEQLHKAMTGRVWESIFYYPVSEWNGIVKSWPIVPPELEEQVAFLSPHVSEIPRQAIHILSSAVLPHGTLTQGRVAEMNPEQLSLYESLQRAGLVERYEYDYEDKFISITPLAWQIILRDIIPYG
jgi:serine/threonine protein kinase